MIVDTTAIHKELTTAHDILLDTEKPAEVHSLVRKTRLDIQKALLNGTEFFIDRPTREKLTEIHTRLPLIAGEAAGKAGALVPHIAAAVAAGAAGAVTHANLTAQQIALNNLGTAPEIAPLGPRVLEYNALRASADRFDIDSTIETIDVNMATAPGSPARLALPHINQSLNAIFIPAGGVAPDYILCDENGKNIPQTGGDYTVSIGGQTVRLAGITFAAGGLDLRNMTITPPLTAYPQKLTLSINARFPNVGGTGINLLCHKPFELELNDGTTALNTAALRLPVVDEYNGRDPGHIVANEITAAYNNRFAGLQRETVFAALKHLDGPRFTQLEEYGRKNGKEEETKEELYQQINRNYLAAGALARQATIDNYANFRGWFVDDARDWNKDKDVIKNNIQYENYLNSNLATRVDDYMKDELDRMFTRDHAVNMRLKTELSTFLTDIERSRNDDERVGGARITTATQANIGPNDQMKTSRRKKFLGIEYGRSDVNYGRFYNGASYEIKDQSVDITTNSRVEDLKNPEPVKYDIETNIASKNNISVTLKFPATDKRYPKKEMILKAGEVSTLARKILNCPDIRDFKVRTHIVYNMLVSMVKISAKKNFSLRYRVPGTPLQRELVMNDKNISLYEWNDTGGIRNERVLFDYDSFLATNTFHGGVGNSRSLQTAIDELMGHFNYAMNAYHGQYDAATRRTLLKTKVSANSFWTSPLKTIMNLKTTRKFDFTATAADEDGKKSVDISVKKNVITLKMGDIEIKGKNLGKLLEYRKNKIRIFDGVERNIVFAFYDELVKKLRENSKINRSNFAVRDELTQNVYVMDEDGELGIITPEDPGDILGGKRYGIVTKIDLDAVDARGGRRICSPAETKEAFMNPCIMGRMIKAMNKRMKKL